MVELTVIQQITIFIIPVLLAITLHEAAHAGVAYYFGDSTAKMLGRLTLNPIKHIDLLGTIVFPLVILILSQFTMILGWAKPVPINASQFKNPRRDLALATLAGPVSNLFMAFLWAGCLKLCIMIGGKSNLSTFISLTSQAGVFINLLLAFINLIPVPPLDGGRILASILPPTQALFFVKIERFGFIILVVLAMTGVLSWFIAPPFRLSLMALHFLFNF